MTVARHARACAQRKLRRLAAGAAATVVLHASVLAAIGPTLIPRKKESQPTVVYARVLPIGLPTASPAAAPMLAAPAATHLAAAALPAAAGPVPVQAAALATVAGLPAIDPIFDRSEFRAADSLTQRPLPTGDVIVDYPSMEGIASVTVRLTLYVDESGRVVHVEPDATGAPPQFIEAAKAAFLNAAFTPGIAADGAVKARLRVEVAFDQQDRRGSIG